MDAEIVVGAKALFALEFEQFLFSCFWNILLGYIVRPELQKIRSRKSRKIYF
jgi:hypothetical protein